MSKQHEQRKRTGIEHIFMLNPYTVSSGIAPRTMDVHLRRGRALHGAAVRAAAGTAARGFATALGRLVAGYRRRQAVTRTERELNALSPRLLRDIGIERYQIPEVARGLIGNDRSLDRPRDPVTTIREVAPVPETGRSFDKAA